MKRLVVFMLLMGSLSDPSALAQWVRAGLLLPGENVTSLAIHPKMPEVLYAATGSFLFRSQDGGKSWMRGLKIGGLGTRVHEIQVHPEHPGEILVATSQGLFHWVESTRRLLPIFESVEVPTGSVETLGIHQNTLLAGTLGGLFLSNDAGLSWLAIPLFKDQEIFQIESWADGSWYVASESGFWHGSPAGESWSCLYPVSGNRVPYEGEEVEADTQEMNARMIPLQKKKLFFLFRNSDPEEILLLYNRWVYWTHTGGKEWIKKSLGLPSGILHRPVGLSGEVGFEKILLPTASGIFYWDLNQKKALPVNRGLPTLTIHDLVYHRAYDTLYLATDRGIFQMVYPETTIYLSLKSARVENGFHEFIDFFQDREPSIHEVQEAAIRYAEVDPEKILAWRRQAQRKAWLPTIGLSQKLGRDANIDLDRGGTNDPDEFISGPDESSRDFSVNLEWDLSDLVWNPDQTSIDNRSKLMVQLRDEILTELNHLYFARRRLQIEQLLGNPETSFLDWEREIQIQEYTAGLDALTGGYFSRNLTSRRVVRERDRGSLNAPRLKDSGEDLSLSPSGAAMDF